MINTVAAQSLRHLFSKSEAIEVNIRCQPSSKLLQGSIDSFRMSGQGLVIRRQFEVEEMSFETDAVAIDFSSALSGKLRLKQPTQAVAQIHLNEAGINRAFAADLVTQRLRQVKIESLHPLTHGEPVSFREVQIELLPQNQIQIAALADLPDTSGVPIQLRATIAVEKRRRITFQNPVFEADKVPVEMQDLSKSLTVAFAEILDNMVDLDRFDLDGVTVRINRLETQGKKLVFSGYAQIERFPGS